MFFIWIQVLRLFWFPLQWIAGCLSPATHSRLPGSRPYREAWSGSKIAQMLHGFSKLEDPLEASSDIYHFLGGSVDGNCSNFFPAFSFTIVSAAFLLSCVRKASVAPRTVQVMLPPPRRSLTHIRMNVPTTTISRTNTNTNVRKSFTLYSLRIGSSGSIRLRLQTQRPSI